MVVVTAGQIDVEDPLVLDHREHTRFGRRQIGHRDGGAIAVDEVSGADHLLDRAVGPADRIGVEDAPAAGRVVALVVEHQRAFAGRGVQPREDDRTVLFDDLRGGLDRPDLEPARRETLGDLGSAPRDPCGDSPGDQREEHEERDAAEHRDDRTRER